MKRTLLLGTPAQRRWLYLLLTALLVLWMTAGGVAALIGLPLLLDRMARLGYPPYFAMLLGAAKLIGAVLIGLPINRYLRLWAYAGVSFEVVAAALSYAAAGYPVESLPPLLFLALVLGSCLLWLRQEGLSLRRQQPQRNVESFEPERVTNRGFVRLYTTLHVKPGILKPLRDRLNASLIRLTDDLFVLSQGGERVAIPLWHLAYHHLTQGRLGGTDYLLTFCPVCNSGMLMSRRVGETVLDFYVVGVYRGTMLMADRQTDSYWDHITGKCLGGYYTGESLELLSAHDIRRAEVAAADEPELLVAIPQLSWAQRVMAHFQNGHVWRQVPAGQFFPGFRESFVRPDTRRPEQELGLGLFGSGWAKFYPLEVLRRGPVNDRVDGHKVGISITVDSKTGIPRAEIDGRLYERQVFARWYGFAQTFPGCAVYAEA